MKIVKLFPTPLYITKINTLDYKKIILEDSDKNINPNEGNTTSENNYVLDKPEFIDLRKKIYLEIEYYFKNIINSSNDFKPIITQSWLNFTKQKQFHHKHNHPNSIVSGVFYVQTDEDDRITFFKNPKDFFGFNLKNNNEFNTSHIYLKVTDGMLILFPSDLFHSVPVKETSGTRVSLSFNTFIKGSVGDKGTLTYLKIE